MKHLYFTFFSLLLFNACKQQETADLILTNAKIYTVDSNFSITSALAVKDGKFVAVGSDTAIRKKYQAATIVDAQQRIVCPGFIDAHCHFFEFAQSLREVNLTGTTSYDAVIERVATYAEKSSLSTWIIGRGWDQNDWKIKQFPNKAKLDALFPNRPIALTRIDGHAILVNQKAIDLAGISTETKIAGGEIVVENGEPTGILIDNAIQLVKKNIPKTSEKQIRASLVQAQNACFTVGLTTLSEAGLRKKQIMLLNSMQRNGELNIRIYAMINPLDKEYFFNTGTIKTNRLNVRSFKLYADGALGSRGACLLVPYQDKPQSNGFLLNNPEDLSQVISEINEAGFQVNTHCIGDSANRLVLNIYGQYLKKANNKRWRIEHAQVVAPSDLKKFAAYNIIPSVQPTHCTSDMYWAADRLGKERVKTAYAFKNLLKQNELIAFGSDFPVEHINPLYGFHAAVARRDIEGFPKGGFQIENSVSRKEALKAMTIWAAYANFEEQEKGSIEVGKWADFVILDKDIMEIRQENLRRVNVLQTFVGGVRVYE